MFAKLPLTALRAFESAARLGGFKSAAEELFVTPAAISLQIKNLEKYLGVTLFARTSSSVVLTIEGEKLFSGTGRALADLACSVEQFTGRSATKVVNVSTTSAFAALWLIPRVSGFYERHPDIQLNIRASNELVDLARDASIDAAIRCVPDNGAQELYSRELMGERFGVYSYTGWQCRDHEVPPVLIRVRWPTPSSIPLDWVGWCKAAGHEDWADRSLYREYDDEHFALQAATAGLGIVLASTVLAEQSLKLGLLTPYKPHVTLPGPTYSVVCVAGRERVESVGKFFDWIEGEAEAARR